MNIHIYVCVCVHVHVCVEMCVYVDMSVCVNTNNRCVYAYTRVQE